MTAEEGLKHLEPSFGDETGTKGFSFFNMRGAQQFSWIFVVRSTYSFLFSVLYSSFALFLCFLKVPSLAPAPMDHCLLATA